MDLYDGVRKMFITFSPVPDMYHLMINQMMKRIMNNQPLQVCLIQKVKNLLNKEEINQQND